MGSMTGSRKLQLCYLAALVALLSLSSVCANTQSQEQAKQDYLVWVDKMGKNFETLPATTSEPAMMDPSYAVSSGPVTINVNPKKGKGDFQSVQDAVNAVPDGTTRPYILRISAGTFKEMVVVKASKGPITFQGAGMTKTKITFHLDSAEADGTMASSTVMIFSDYFICKDIAFENTSPSPLPGAVGEQAVAFMIQGDKAAFYRCAFFGFQDTLYDKQGRHYWKDCYIRGTIDFIFGDGQSYYENCYLDSVATTFGSLTAQKREYKTETSGYSFVNCTVNGTGYSYLGRAWGNYSTVVFIDTYLSSAIRPEGWFDWGVPAREQTVFYGEYHCYGPGANRAGRPTWSLELSPTQVKPFLTVDWIQGKTWIPTGPQ